MRGERERERERRGEKEEGRGREGKRKRKIIRNEKSKFRKFRSEMSAPYLLKLALKQFYDYIANNNNIHLEDLSSVRPEPRSFRTPTATFFAFVRKNHGRKCFHHFGY